MGQKTRGIYPDENENGKWQVDKWWRGQRFRERGFPNFEEAERWLIGQLAAAREVAVHGARPKRTFEQASVHYLETHQEKTSLETEVHLLKGVMPFIGGLELHQVHDSSLAPFIADRLAKKRARKTINLALGVVRHILNLAATAWRDETGLTWLQHPPKITLLSLVGHQREPQPISWAEQRRLLPELPTHLARMSLFTLNTGARDNVVCSLRWEWEIQVPELGVSVFEVPRTTVKGRRSSRVLVCNAVAQSVLESVRGMHPERVFVYRQETARKPPQAFRGIEAMNNTAWQKARARAGLGDLHVHDLRHTVGMRLREAGVAESTISDLLWHKTATMTRHYTMAQIVELHGALEKIKDDSGRWNKSLATLKLEHQEKQAAQASPPKVPQQRKTG